MNQSFNISLVAISVVLGGCISPEGWTQSDWSKQELVAWYNKYEPTNSNLTKFGYAGSDDRFHYFVTRPVDSFFTPRIPRSELAILDERSRSDLGRRLYFYRVDPSHNFRKISED
ncbi:MAG: hypothetical protein EOP09_17150 [Proteobacteria bacterium]|nr:MAG: hypothetical protein EOP09_17150 [Pseudomonadota bacterium]